MSYDLVAHLYRQRAFSRATFGPGRRVAGVSDHIRKELVEFARASATFEAACRAAGRTKPKLNRKLAAATSEDPGIDFFEADHALKMEAADVILLSLDLAWRAGISPEGIAEAVHYKQWLNEGRDWPDWRTQDPDRPIEHTREGEAAGNASPRLPASLGRLLDEIGAERMRQVQVEGFDGAHDLQHFKGELAEAASAYAVASTGSARAPHLWPWNVDYFKPKGPREDLIRAAALILAQIDQLDGIERQAASEGEAFADREGEPLSPPSREREGEA